MYKRTYIRYTCIHTCAGSFLFRYEPATAVCNIARQTISFFFAIS